MKQPSLDTVSLTEDDVCDVSNKMQPFALGHKMFHNWWLIFYYYIREVVI